MSVKIKLSENFLWEKMQSLFSLYNVPLPSNLTKDTFRSALLSSKQLSTMECFAWKNDLTKDHVWDFFTQLHQSHEKNYHFLMGDLVYILAKLGILQDPLWDSLKKSVPSKLEVVIDNPEVKGLFPGMIVRVLGPDSLYTMEHNENRMNLVLDEKGVLLRSWVG